ADLQHALLDRYALELVERIDVNQQLRRREPHVEGRNQALAAGEQACVAVLRQQRDRLVDRSGLGKTEWRRLQRASSRRVIVIAAIVAEKPWASMAANPPAALASRARPRGLEKCRENFPARSSSSPAAVAVSVGRSRSTLRAKARSACSRPRRPRTWRRPPRPWRRPRPRARPSRR